MMTEHSQFLVPVSPSVPRPFWRRPRFWLVLAVLALVGWQWRETQMQLAAARHELANSIAEGDKRMQETEKKFAKAVAETADLEQKYRDLAARQEEFQGQADALRQIYQEASLSREDALLAEIEHNLGFAAQQLQLSGNVQAAILILADVDNRLARIDSPLFLPLRRALAQELEQLRATPFVDVPGMSLRLEGIVASIDKLPLAITIPTRATASTPHVTEDASVASWWRQLLQESWQEVKSMVRVQRFDRQEPVLLQPDQALILRENIKLRLLNARLALFSRDQWTFRNELNTARQWLRLYFNTQEKSVETALEALQQLERAELIVEFPALNDSLIAVQTLKANREKR